MNEKQAPGGAGTTAARVAPDTEPGSEVDAYLASVQLTPWWLSHFIDSERKYVRVRSSGSAWSWSWGFDDAALHDQRLVSDVLCELASFFRTQHERSLARRFFEKAEELAKADPIDLHFTYTQMIRFYCREMPPEAQVIQLAEQACQKQISIATSTRSAYLTLFPGESLAGHPGFEQLAILREHETKFYEAIQLCQQAAAQGWAGDWEWRIRKCQAKLEEILRAR